MGFDKVKIRQIRNLILMTAGLVLVIMYSGKILDMIWLVIGILSTFIAGGAVAFVINIPMNFFEKKLFGKAKSKRVRASARPLSLILALIVILAIIAIVISVVIPQLVRTVTDLGSVVPSAVTRMVIWLEAKFSEYPWVIEQLQKIDVQQFNWASTVEKIVDFLKNGFGSFMSSTVNAAGRVVNAFVRAIIAFIFALYVLVQKETLISQTKRIMCAYVPMRTYLWIRKTVRLMAVNFKNFITGQCLEAVIIGAMFVLALTILRLPYALLVGVLIAFTALVPIVGSFVGCVISAFLMLMTSPVKMLIFLITFIIIQQVEGNLIYPKVVGNSVGLPSIWVLAAVSIGSSLMGVVGMLTFIPLMATAYTMIRDDVNNRNKGKHIK